MRITYTEAAQMVLMEHWVNILLIIVVGVLLGLLITKINEKTASMDMDEEEFLTLIENEGRND